jgi:hypothetical protein
LHKRIIADFEEVLMKRIGLVFLMTVLALFALFGCKEKGTEAKVTGIELRFRGCLTFEAWVWIDDEYQGSYTSEQPSTIELPSGAHTLYARSNMFVSGDTMFCWTTDFSVVQDKVVQVYLDCPGNKCTLP